MRLLALFSVGVLLLFAQKETSEQIKQLADREAVRVAAEAASQSVARASTEASIAVARASSVAQYQLWGLLVTTFVGFASIIWKDIRSDKREQRQRDWALADAEAKDQKLKQIHTLVNSTLTEAMMRELNAQKSLLDFMIKAVEQDKSNGKTPEDTLLAQIQSTTVSLKLLEAQMLDREKQTIIANSERVRNET